ncbi:MAG: uroporphyrinogen decarboxylase family protein, partial [Candidatus Latescibacteria bacterium]|nr:uroporphyrinogen decarboxylase family protein [Candidatus Latescibacterota bacterium]
MTGRQKIEAAFSEAGSPEIPAVICYEGICIRDHWEELTACPWWYRFSPDLGHQLSWRRDAIEAIGQDWFDLPPFYTRKEREDLSIQVQPEGVFWVNKQTGDKERLAKPQIGGWSELGGLHSVHPKRLAKTPEAVKALIPIPPDSDPTAGESDGRRDLSVRMLEAFGEDLFPTWTVSAPLWRCYSLWGFEGMMIMVATHPELVELACQRSLMLCLRSVREAASHGAAGIWIEDCLTDMISPEASDDLNVPYLARLVDEIRDAGMKSVYYYCGSPEGKWQQIFSIGADAISLEESKKDFTIDIKTVVEQVQGKCTVLGNLDAIGVLQDGTEEQVRAE